MGLACRGLVVASSLVVLIPLLVFQEKLPAFWENVSQHVCFFAGLMIFFSLIACFEGCKYLKAIRFLGRNTLIILGCHIMFEHLTIVGVKWVMQGNHSVYTGLVETVLTVLASVIFVLLSVKYIPRLVGKVDPFPCWK